MAGRLSSVVHEHPETLPSVEDPALGHSAVCVEQHVTDSVSERLLHNQCNVSCQYDSLELIAGDSVAHQPALGKKQAASEGSVRLLDSTIDSCSASTFSSIGKADETHLPVWRGITGYHAAGDGEGLGILELPEMADPGLNHALWYWILPVQGIELLERQLHLQPQGFPPAHRVKELCHP